MFPKLLKSYKLKRKRRKVGPAGCAISTVLTDSRGREIATIASADVDYVAKCLRKMRD